MASDEECCELLWDGVAVTAAPAEHFLVERSVLRNLSLADIRWRHGQWTDVRLEHCDLANAVWEAAVLDRVEAERCRGTGFRLSDSQLQDVRLSHGKLNLSIWHDSRLERSVLEHCDLREADFQGGRMRQVAFHHCDLRGARFCGVAMEQVDVRGSHLAGVHFDREQLRHLTVEASQLPVLAELLGLTVAELNRPAP